MADEGARICGHLHIPLQSGSDRILAMMKRPYTTEQFNAVLARVRGLLPRSGISTDVIAGFPGETQKDFEDTYEFIERAGFSRLHVFKYSIREGTAAASFNDHVPPRIISERARSLKSLDSRLQREFWKHFIGQRVQVVREKGNNSLITDNYIKLKAEPGFDSVREPVFYAELIEKNGQPWAVPTVS
jgi:threonylcarbamoyladenosine tRNA methylthiotransferase MtaB